MAKIEDAMAYLLSRYPHAGELSNARVTKMLYLADWKQAIEHRRQVTPIRWKFDNFGPFVWDVRDAAEAMPERFTIEQTSNWFGTPKVLLKLAHPKREAASAVDLKADEQAALDHVIEQTKGLYWDGFIKLVYSTHPIMSSSRYCELNLIAKANEYVRTPL